MMSENYAIVTGASEGIGFEFTKVMASLKYNLIIIARRENLLSKQAKKLESEFDIKCLVLALDLSNSNSAEEIFSFIKKNNITVNFLINNAGMLQNGYFSELPIMRQQQMINLNIMTLTKLSHLFINYLKLEGTAGHLLNVASLAGWIPIPNQNVYSASKSFVLSFSLALSDELKASGDNITVSALCPGFTATKMMNNPDQGGILKIPNRLMLSAHKVAEVGIRGCLSGRRLIVPGIMNKLTCGLTHCFSKEFLSKHVGNFYRKNMT